MPPGSSTCLDGWDVAILWGKGINTCNGAGKVAVGNGELSRSTGSNAEIKQCRQDFRQPHHRSEERQ